MVPRSQHTPAWRLFGAALGAFAIAVQLVLFAFLIVQAASAANPADLTQADLGVICTHDPAAAPTTDDGGAPPAPSHQHGQCPACAYPQWAKVLAPLPMAPVLLVLLPHSQTMPDDADVAVTELNSPSPYASRAPPFSA